MNYTIQEKRPMIPLAAEKLPTHYETFLKAFPTYACMIMPQLDAMRWRVTHDHTGLVAEVDTSDAPVDGQLRMVRFDAWPLRVSEGETFFLAPSRETMFSAIGPGQIFNGKLTGEEAGMCITAMALNNIAFSIEDNEELVTAWQLLMDAVYEHPGASKMTRVLD